MDFLDNPSPGAWRASLRWLLLMLLVGLLAGCATLEPPRPYTTEAEALSARGEPTRRWSNDDGTSTLEYPTQPARVERGMDKEQVSRLLGTHRSEQRFRNSGEEVWDWNIRNDGPGIATLFNVHFIDGKVVRTSQTYVFPRDGAVYGGWSGYYGHPWGWGIGWGYPGPFFPRPFGHPFFW